MELFAERLERLIKEKKLTQIVVADTVGIRRPTISDWKKNGSYPTADVAVKIAKLLEVSVEYLITGKEDNPYIEENKNLKEKIQKAIEALQA
ncbi:MAG: helix-turn-helix transcriptional regulator [Treponema sp.]|nr:helix-turn-helix transcriptional regulator [Treponema sp.]